MGPQEWKGSIKATHLVIAIHDHFVWKLQYAQKKATNTSESQPIEQAGSTNHVETLTASTLPETPVEDMWALEYITVDRIQSLMEALDDDGSSFVTVYEVNEFTSSRPEKWRRVPGTNATLRC